jgi:hypothetical protein
MATDIYPRELGSEHSSSFGGRSSLRLSAVYQDDRKRLKLTLSQTSLTAGGLAQDGSARAALNDGGGVGKDSAGMSAWILCNSSPSYPLTSNPDRTPVTPPTLPDPPPLAMRRMYTPCPVPSIFSS